MAHTYDNKNTLARGRSSAGRDISITLGSGATLIVLSIVVDGLTARGGGAPVFDPTGANITMTQADQIRFVASTGETVVELYYCYISGITGSKTVHIPDSNNMYFSADISSYKATPGLGSELRAASGAVGTSTNPTGPTHTSLAAGDVIVAVVGDGAATWNPSAWTGTSLYDVDDGQYGHGTQYYITPNTSNVTMAWTQGSNEDWAIVSAVFKETVPVITGTLSKTITAITSAESGAVNITGTSTGNLTQFSSAESGAVKVAGTLSSTLSSETSLMNGMTVSNPTVCNILTAAGGSVVTIIQGGRYFPIG